MIAPVLMCMSLGTGLAKDPAPVQPTQDGPGPTGPMFVRALRPEPPPRRRGLVFAFMPALTFGLAAVPSLDLPFYFGGRLRGPWALGYQFTWSSGGAERYVFGLMTHRHHITGMRGFGRGGRGLATVGGGAAFLWIVPIVEVEGRVAWRFGKRRRGFVGGVARLGWNVGYGEYAPLPQLGVVLGVTTL